MRTKQSFRQFRGEISNVQAAAAPNIKNAASLNDMANASLNYLNRNPEKCRCWECKFNMYATHIPYHFVNLRPNKYAYDVISLADTDLRMNLVYQYMRKLAGVTESSIAELGVRTRAMAYLRDGLCYANPSALTGTEVEDEWMTPWGTGNLILFMCDEYDRTGDPAWSEKVTAALDKLLALCVKGDGMQTFAHGLSPYLNGEWLATGWLETHGKNYAFILEPLVRGYEITGNEAYLRDAILFAESIVNRMREDRDNCEIDPETGSFGAHVHTHTRTLWGLSHLAYVTKDARYTELAKRMFDYVVKGGTDFGWYPEFLMQSELKSETCINGDMMASAYYLSQCGFLDLYDTMERNWRNYLYRAQFKITPDFVAVFRKIHADKTEAEITDALEKLRALEGGFSAQLRWNDLAQCDNSEYSVYMMGCCPPSAMLAIAYIARAAVMKKPDGIYINMTATVNTDDADLVSDYTEDALLKITAKTAGTYYIRVPEWTEPGSARVRINGADIPFVWDGPQCRYMKAEGVSAGDVLQVYYTLFSFTQKIQVTSVPNCRDVYTMHWLGNAVTSVEPKSDFLDLFSDQRGIY